MSPHCPQKTAALTIGWFALTCAPALADTVCQPRLVEPSSFHYEYYYDNGAERSPSDAPSTPAPMPPTAAAPVPASPAVTQSPSYEHQPCCDYEGRCWGAEIDCGCEPWSLGNTLCGCDAWMQVGGWTQLGYHSNFTPLSRPGNPGLSFNDRPDRLNLHQQWLYLERVADGSNGVDFGFRFDILYGIDAQKTQAFGNPRAATPGFGAWDASLDNGAYGWAMPQLYGEVALGDLSIIAGHFYTLVGYEVVPAPENFFYSHSLTMFNSEPFTHTGLIASYSGIDGLRLYGGWTLGWDTGFDQANGGSNYLGGFSGELTDDVTVTYISTIGNLGLRSGGGSGYSHSVVFDVALSQDLNYVLQSDYLDYVDRTGAAVNDDQLGINQYLFYTLNDTTAVGARMEWWKSDGVSFYELTYGVNYRLGSNMIVRPEVRHDWSPTGGAYADGSDHQTTFGIDWILTY